MKKYLFPALSCLALIATSFANPPGSLLGRWQPKPRPGIVGMVIFRADSSWDASVNGKAFVSGKYYVRQDTFVERSSTCRLAGVYKLHFFAEDSVRFTVIQDSCRGRREGYNGLTLWRIKPDPTK